MPIDTTLDGDPSSIQAVGQWLESAVADGIHGAAKGIIDARERAGTSWTGEAHAAFAAKMTQGSAKAGQLAAVVARTAQALHSFASDLAQAQSSMRAARQIAASARLTVNGHVIQDPGPQPALPPRPMGPTVTPQEAAAHDQAVAAYNIHCEQVQAYAIAQLDHDNARQLVKLATDTLSNVWSDLTGKWFFTLADLTSGAASTLAVAQASTLTKQAVHLTDEAARLMDQAHHTPAGTAAKLIYRDADASRAAGYEAEKIMGTAEKIEKAEPRIGLKAGGALAVAGVAYDIYNGKPVDQAVVSGAAGFGASVATGAVLGTLIPVPVLGTAAGAVGGAVVGLFASGMVDSLYQNGTDSIGQAFDDGLKAVEDTGDTIANAAEDAWRALF